MDERMDYMGFEHRPFPSLSPLAAHQPSGGAAGGSMGGAGSIRSHVFAEWAQEAGGDLPVLAQQWHDVLDRCAALLLGARRGAVHSSQTEAALLRTFGEPL